MRLLRRIRELFLTGHRVMLLDEKIGRIARRIEEERAANDNLRILNAMIYSKLLEKETSPVLSAHEFKVYSQYGDDGIIDFLIRTLDIDARTFVEFGVENYREANTRYLLVRRNWKGLVIDGSARNIDEIRTDEIYWKHNLTAVAAFVTKENINDLLQHNGFIGQVGILHIDIDGNDYWVWKEIKVIDPQIVIMEYNAVFALKPWTVPYDPAFYRTEKHHSNLYFGASLTALCQLADEKGYSFVGCNSHGNNAYFVRNDKLKILKKLKSEEGFVNSEFRESRDRNGHLTFVSEQKRIDLIRGMPVFNTLLGKTENI
jgi:hypothetical protein